MHRGGVLWCTDEGKGDLRYERGTSVRISATFSPRRLCRTCSGELERNAAVAGLSRASTVR